MVNAMLLAPRRLRTAVVRLALRPLRVRTRKRFACAVVNTVSPSTPLVMTTGDPIVIASSAGVTDTQPSSHRAKASKAIAKDALLLSLEALSESADAFPPLKSAVGGLLFIVKQLDLVSSNKAELQDMHAYIDGCAASLERAVPDVTELSPTAKEAIRALAEDIQAVRNDMGGIACQKLLVRFFRAKRHSKRLRDLAKRLAQADVSCTRTMLASMDVQGTQILCRIQSLQKDVHRISYS